MAQHQHCKVAQIFEDKCVDILSQWTLAGRVEMSTLRNSWRPTW